MAECLPRSGFYPQHQADRQTDRPLNSIESLTNMTSARHQIRVSINCDKSLLVIYVFTRKWYFTFVVFFPQAYNCSIILRKIPEKS